MLAAGEGAPAAAPSGGPGAVAACATGAAELIAWKSHLGVSISADKRLLRSSAKGWGRSGALSELRLPIASASLRGSRPTQ